MPFAVADLVATVHRLLTTLQTCHQCAPFHRRRLPRHRSKPRVLAAFDVSETVGIPLIAGYFSGNMKIARMRSCTSASL
jgi:hypothetical protein